MPKSTGHVLKSMKSNSLSHTFSWCERVKAGTSADLLTSPLVNQILRNCRGCAPRRSLTLHSGRLMGWWLVNADPVKTQCSSQVSGKGLGGVNLGAEAEEKGRKQNERRLLRGSRSEDCKKNRDCKRQILNPRLLLTSTPGWCMKKRPQDKESQRIYRY